MFGQQQPTTSPFGNPGATSGGTSLFGAPSATPAFGSTTPAFGSTTSATPTNGGFGFGSAAPTPSTGFGGFGSNTTTPASSGFGGFGSAAPAQSSFGASASTPFGSPAPSRGLFGATPAPAPSGGLFGGGSTSTGFGASTATSATSAFGAPTPSSFGASSAFGGAPTPAPSGGLFGAPATSAFGSSAPATNAFGAPAPSGGMFGSTPAAATSTGLFGGQSNAGHSGTLQTPYSDTSVPDGSTVMVLKTITGMQAYQSKSVEELRLEDYMNGNKGAQGQNIAASAPSGGLFGSAPAAPSAFGAPAPSGFGSPAPAFGSPAPSAFGAAPAPTGGMFGSTAPAFGSPGTSTFGAPAPASGGLFGAPTPAPSGGLFGSAAPAPASGGLFGNTAPAPASGGLFGNTAPAPASGGLFGSTPAPATGGLFGSTPAPAPSGGLFGSTPAPAPSGGLFGSAAPAPSGGLFGSTPAPAPSGGLFGSTPAPAPSGGLFGSTPAPAPSGGLFGSAPAASGGLFGSTPAPSGGLFNGTAAASKPVTGGLFGAPAPASGGLFGAPAASTGSVFGSTPAASTFGAPLAPAAATTTVIVPPSADTLLAQQLAAVETQKKEMALLESLRGYSPGYNNISTSGNIIPTSIFQRDAAAVRYRGLAGSGNTSQALSSSYPQKAPKSIVKVRPRGFGPPSHQTTLNISNTRNKSASPASFLGSATKRLVIKPDAHVPKPKTRLLLVDESKNGDILQSDKSNVIADKSSKRNDVIQGIVLENNGSNTPASQRHSSPHMQQSPSPYGISRIANQDVAFTSPDADFTINDTKKKESPEVMSSAKNTSSDTEAYDYYRAVIGSPSFTDTNKSRNDSIPKLTRDGYSVSPSLGDIAKMSEADLAAVSNFSVHKVGVGTVTWDGAVDIRGIDLDSVISINPKDLSVYEKQEELGTKPPEGTKLNRPAVITFYEVFPKDGPKSSAEMKQKYQQKIKKSTTSMGAEFISYDADKGIWIFRVPHFSRYALVEDSDEEDEKTMVSNNIISQQQDFESGTGGGLVQESSRLQGQRYNKRMKLSRIQSPSNEDEGSMDIHEDESLLLSSEGDANVHQAAEAAYSKMAQLQAEISYMDMDELNVQISNYTDECEIVDDYNTTNSTQVLQIISATNSSFSVCDRIAKQCEVTNVTSSSTDFSLRFGRSFKVGWKGDGSLNVPQYDHKNQCYEIVQRKPVLPSSEISVELLATHLQHSKRVIIGNEIPMFMLPMCGKTKDVNILSDYRKICKNHSSLECGDQVIETINHAFDLIESLKDIDSSNRSLAFSNWLRNLCMKSVEKDISSALHANNCCGAIFAALSGGDESKASSLARKNGLLNLSLIIPNATLQSSIDIAHQIKLWEDFGVSEFIPNQLERLYSFLSRDLGLEESFYSTSVSENRPSLDWKRRLTMLYTCLSVTSSDESDLISNLLEQYDSDVKHGKAPPAKAWYISEPEIKENETCILYRLLMMLFGNKSHNSNSSLSYAISFNGYTPNPHDVCFSFHMACVLSSLQLCEKKLTETEECRLLESYALNLIQDGRWEWAVYTILCNLSTNQVSKAMLRWKKKMSIDIICKHYTNKPELQQKREFLEKKVGVPSDWFNSSLSYQSKDFNFQNKMTAKAANDYLGALISHLEEIVIPSILFDGDRDRCDALISYLDELHNELGEVFSTSLSALFLQYLKLSQNLYHFLREDVETDSDVIQQSFDVMIKNVEQLKVALFKLQQRTSKNRNIDGTIPRCIVLAEFENALNLLIVHLNVIKGGGSIFEPSTKGYDHSETRSLKLLSKLGHMLSKNNDITLPFSQIIRGKAGIDIVDT